MQRSKPKRPRRPVSRKNLAEHSAALAASLASGEHDDFTILLLALGHCAARVGIPLPTDFIPLEEKLAAILRSLDQHRGENADFLMGAHLLVQKIRSAHRTQTQLARRSKDGWTN